MMHCGGGAGSDSFNGTLRIPPQPPAYGARHDIFSALIDWADGGKAPDDIIATKFASDDVGKVEIQRPLCPYPRKAVYRGWGSTSSASNFACTAPDAR